MYIINYALIFYGQKPFTILYNLKVCTHYCNYFIFLYFNLPPSI